MALGNVFDTAASAMSANSIRLNTTASNLANAEAAASSSDQTYRARHPVFAAATQQAMAINFDTVGEDKGPVAGVQVLGIVESGAPLQQRYEPDHPLANEEGYVFYPNVNPVEEMANMISASRAYQMNVEVMNSAKTMMQRVLTLGQ
ncbi:flagellar basal body rod protein FlgC [Marinibactrum halimedae]|uniref:Flagellar basal-body rod protein FlgC n=1 Tax=Marinibactrum halimedae TaxID=1444977 RepID=A0AA37WMB1_9GAMM|nr:flagellar basal body rod protein FlgC [Marinibactrum halimedae]MCD9458393.1 flagellar basal body rod protein FlgC [Marinibactrum halimedae]GLS26090.1 flagellar basal-body rod protein FlgC [Marinibactrum halimedae]